MSRRRYFEERRSGNGAIYHCVKTEIEPGDRIRLFNLMNKVKSDTISQDKINSVLNQLREGILSLYLCDMRRRFENKDRELEDFIIRFYPAGNYTWVVPDGCFLVDVFLVGGGGSGSSAGGDGTVLIRGKRYKS